MATGNPFTSAQAAQTMQAMPSDLVAQQTQLTRQQQMAELLRKQGLEPDGGTEVVSGWAVKKSPMEGLAKLAQALSGTYIQGETDKKQGELTQEGNKQLVDGLQKYQSLMQGSPAQNTQIVDDEYGPQTITNPAVPGNKQAALAQLLQSGHPMLQQMGVAQLTAKPESAFSKVDPKDFTQESVAKFAATQNYADLIPARKMEVAPSGVAFNPYSVKEGTTFQDPNKPFNVGTDGIVPNLPYQEYEKSKAKAGASNVNNTVSVAGPENQYNKDIGAGLAKESLALVESAKAAPETINNARMIKKALDAGAITGTGADTKLAIQKALETAGVLGAGKAASTEELIAGLGKLTLAGIKTSGLGGGNGFTNSDREFLSSAISGTIASTPANIRRVADLSERVATANHKKGQQVLGRWQSNPSLQNFSQDVQIDPLPPAPAPTPPAPASGGGKKLIYNPATGGFN